MTRAGPLAAILAAVCLAAPAVADEIPTFLVKARYADARPALVGGGWRPAPGSADPARCARGFEAQCSTYPETEYCAGDGLPRCVFLWRDAEGTLIELRTIGREDPVVEIVRCRASCRAGRPERASFTVARAAPPPPGSSLYLRRAL